MNAALAVVPFLSVVASAADVPNHPNPIGLLRTVMSAQAVYKQKHPELGYACGFAPLIEAKLLSGKVDWTRPQGDHIVSIECTRRDLPQTSFRASVAPKAGATGRAYCTKDGQQILVSEGDAAACVESGEPLK